MFFKFLVFFRFDYFAFFKFWELSLIFFCRFQHPASSLNLNRKHNFSNLDCDALRSSVIPSCYSLSLWRESRTKKAWKRIRGLFLKAHLRWHNMWQEEYPPPALPNIALCLCGQVYYKGIQRNTFPSDTDSIQRAQKPTKAGTTAPLTLPFMKWFKRIVGRIYWSHLWLLKTRFAPQQL